jgi:hypothetical protein
MTTTVIIKAHCSPDKQVKIGISGGTPEEVILQDGEVHETVVYDDREVSIKEELK